LTWTGNPKAARHLQLLTKDTAMEQNASRKRSVIVRNRRTSISLEDSFWDSLNAIVRMENITIGNFIEKTKARRPSINLSSSLRVAVLEYYQNLAASQIGANSNVDTTTQPRTDRDSSGRSQESQAQNKTMGFWNDPDRRQNQFIAAHDGSP
jgi:predicted DNA-binding ribbon-helix-helix protein